MDRVAVKFDVVVAIVLFFAAVGCWLCVKIAFGVSMFWPFFGVHVLAWCCCIFCSLHMLSIFCAAIGIASFVCVGSHVLMHVFAR